MTEIEKNIQLKSTVFSPSELALIAPDITLTKYLKAGYRPSLRKFNEFKPIIISTAGISRYDTKDTVNESTTVIGSSSIKCGGTSTICTISAGIVEDDFEAVNDYRMRLDADIIVDDSGNGSINGNENTEEIENVLGGDLINKNGTVFPVVEIAKGTTGPPGPEEIELGEKLYESILHSGLISRDELKIDVGLQSIDENGNQVILTGDDVGTIKKKFSFVLYARLQVFGRTGPLFDQCYASLVKALKDTKLPDIYLNERESNLRTRGGKRNANVNIQNYDLVCDPIKYRTLKLRNDRICWASTFGIVDYLSDGDDFDEDEIMEGSSKEDKTSILLTDLEGDAENHISKRICALSNGKEEFVSITIEKGEGERISKRSIVEALQLSQTRAADMIDKF
jgi:exosome complex component RRP43